MEPLESRRLLAVTVAINGSLTVANLADSDGSPLAVRGAKVDATVWYNGTTAHPLKTVWTDNSGSFTATLVDPTGTAATMSATVLITAKARDNARIKLPYYYVVVPTVLNNNGWQFRTCQTSVSNNSLSHSGSNFSWTTAASVLDAGPTSPDPVTAKAFAVFSVMKTAYDYANDHLHAPFNPLSAHSLFIFPEFPPGGKSGAVVVGR